MKEKLKKLKSCLKLWNKETYGNLQKLAKEILVKINDLDLKDSWTNKQKQDALLIFTTC